MCDEFHVVTVTSNQQENLYLAVFVGLQGFNHCVKSQDHVCGVLDPLDFSATLFTICTPFYRDVYGLYAGNLKFTLQL